MHPVAQRFRELEPFLDERLRRVVAAAEARVIGYGGVTAVAKATGVSRRAIHEGLKELKAPRRAAPPGRVRKPGGGRKTVVERDSTLVGDLERLVAPSTAGDPMRALRWTSKSLAHLATELGKQGHEVSPPTVSSILLGMGYRLQANRKAIEGTSHPDRDAQFHHINDTAVAFLKRGDPVISVDTKKKELVGEFKNAGREWRPTGQPQRVRVHDFLLPELGKAIPYGVYDVAANEGWVSVGTDHDTATFAVETIRRWWRTLGKPRYPKAKRIFITADGGGSNASRSRLWKHELQKFVDESGLRVTVSHFPPGTSKWNAIEHRLFSFISINWRGKPLVSHQVILDLIAATKTQKGLRVKSQLDTNEYPLGVKVSDGDLDRVNLIPDPFHGEWNYGIHPSS